MQTTIVHQGQVIEPEAFERRWRRSAAALRGEGVQPGDVVALLLRNTPEAVELMLATRHLGARYCPINWHFKTDEVQYILDNSGAKLLIADAGLLAALPDLHSERVTIWTVREALPGRPSWIARRDDADADAEAGLAAAPRGPMFYTSGTTGRPKGIVRDAMTPAQQQASAEMRRAAYGVRPNMRALFNAPWYHSAPSGYLLTIALEGGLLVLEERFDAERTLQLIEQHLLTHAYLVPTMYVRLLALPAEVRARYALGSMRFVASTGSPCLPTVKRSMIDWWGPVIYECYGASELGFMTLLTPEQALQRPGSVGRPLPGVTLTILDEQGNSLPPRTRGLIYIDQPAMSDFSYVGNDAARRSMERKGLKTMGDVGYLDDEGYLYIVDRQADMVISGGVNIYPAETELALQAMPGVADCAVFGIPDDEFGEALAAAVQPAPGVTLSAEAVRVWLRERIAGYKVPNVVTLHDLLPREDTGKIFKRKLREPYWAGRERRV